MICFADIEKETVLLTKKGVYTVDDLASLVPTEKARYHLFRHGNNPSFLISSERRLFGPRIPVSLMSKRR